MSEDETKEIDRLLGINIHPEPEEDKAPRMSLYDTFIYLIDEQFWMSPEQIEARLREAM